MSAINLDHKGISMKGPEFQAIAPNLQSNILKAHSRDYAKLLFLQFEGVDTAKAWIRNLVRQEKYVWSAGDQQVDTEAYKKGLGSRTVANFYLTAKGYERLGFDLTTFTHGAPVTDQDDAEEDEADDSASFGNRDFVRGMRSDRVNKKLDDPSPDQWEPEYNQEIHALLLLADDEEARVAQEAAAMKAMLGGVAKVLKEETGNNLKEQLPSGKRIGIEHFGYADGISQPRYFTEDTRTSPMDLQPLSLILVKDPFTGNGEPQYGSFVVYRKLGQDVTGFNNKVAELAGHLQLNAAQQGKITKEDYAGALAVGRFKDGTPLVSSDVPLGDAPAFNDFRYEQVDRPAHKCPFHAHIRKTNPRGQGILVQEKGRFVTRRGIPYGKIGDNGPKGLLFMCFQANLKRQFNFIQKAWANTPGFPLFRGKPGIDPLIGQGHDGGQSWPKEYGSEDEIGFNFAGFIKLEGGEYFFAPSLGFLRNI